MNLENIIYTFRGQRVILDRDIAKLYGVTTKRLNEQVRRNFDRFPEDFAFRLDKIELENWRSQIATSNPELKMGLRHSPLAFTEHGTVMLANVLRSKHAVQMSIEVVRAFIELRQQKILFRKVDEICDFIIKKSHKDDKEFRKLWRAIEFLECGGESLIGFKPK
ncbi:ORF6N domain-containing protein [Patescibacteria group bacterium]|nr:ORF6N domain-containing protein [Patescibacteria group bacterium]